MRSASYNRYNDDVIISACDVICVYTLPPPPPLVRPVEKYVVGKTYGFLKFPRRRRPMFTKEYPVAHPTTIDHYRLK